MPIVQHRQHKRNKNAHLHVSRDAKHASSPRGDKVSSAGGAKEESVEVQSSAFFVPCDALRDVKCQNHMGKGQNLELTGPC